ncbi:ER-derived vesicles protein erv46 [Polyrhizophydium stewartii]|uniref:ER-derived vesicles protein erv46 n=1 Tax=Polyrhizophydium stewartii TaxID=2732419 RepID=A0ABR4N6J5_9FUNG
MPPAVTILSTLFILFLTFSEFVDWYQKEMVPSLEVDKGRKERMNINLNITFPHMPCYMLSIDVMDVAGEHQNNLPHSMHKTRIDQFGNIIEKNRGELGGKDAGIDKTAVDKTADPKYCGSCYGGVAPASGCCNSCEDVRSAYERAGWSFSDPDSIEQCVREGWSKKIKEQSKESCNVHGHVEVNKVQGNLHFAPGRSFQQNNMHVHDLHDFGVEGGQFNFEHTIHSLSFGDQVDFVNPLDNVHKKPPASVFFNFEISPMLVKYKEFRKPFTHFLTDLCAIVGGVFTVAGMIDGFLYATQRSLKAKTELGKNT